jgi:hypothetical protein
MEDGKATKSDEVDQGIVKTKIDENTNQFDVYGSVFTLPKRYEVTKPLGSGAYG